MNYYTITGAITGFVTLAVIIFYTADNPWAFINLPGLILVLGGTISAVLVSFPKRDVSTALGLFKVVLTDGPLDIRRDIDDLIRIAGLWISSDIKGIEKELVNINNTYLRTGIQLIIDKAPLEDTLSLLKWRIARLKARERAEARIFRAMATFAPAFGMVGTLVGLISMMQAIEERNFAVIGTSMSIALVTTFYGILLANLVFKPIALKLERRTDQRVYLMSMVMEGISLISRRRTPSFIRETLNSFIAHYDDELDQPTVDIEEDKFGNIEPIIGMAKTRKNILDNIGYEQMRKS